LFIASSGDHQTSPDAGGVDGGQQPSTDSPLAASRAKEASQCVPT
jgi:hypothetical protein